jgi:hypothetical protein
MMFQIQNPIEEVMMRNNKTRDKMFFCLNFQFHLQYIPNQLFLLERFNNNSNANR